MNRTAYLFIGFLCAIFAPVLLFAPFSLTASVAVLMFAGGHAIFLGVPAYLLLDRFKRVSAFSILVSGFLIASIPEAVRSWPLQYPELKTTSSQWDGAKMMATMIDGVPTFAGWTSYLQGIGFFGMFGLFSAYVFWLVWRHAPAKP